MTEEQRQLERLNNAVFGNGKAGLDDRVVSMERYLFADPQTGSKGLVATVAELNSYVHRLQNTLSVLNWLLGILGLGGVIALVRYLAGG